MNQSDDSEVEVRRQVYTANNEAMRTNKCQTSEGADRTGSYKAMSRGRSRAGAGVEGKGVNGGR